ncbi:hypothetical protein ACIL2R_000368 [Vibrio vulnificus]
MSRRIKKPRKGKKQSKLSTILGIDRSKYDVVRLLHGKMTAKEIEHVVPTLVRDRDFYKQINLSVDKTFSDYYDINLPFLDLNKNLAWCVGVLSYHSEKLKKFRSLEQKLQELILEEKFDNAINVIEDIDDICGLSVYSIGLKSSIYKLSGQEEKHNDLISRVSDDKNFNGFFKTICKYAMDRYDDSSLSITSSESTRKQILRTMDEDFSSFLIYKITPKDYLSDLEIDYNIVLEYEKRCSIIDIYKAIIEYVEIEASKNKELSDSVKSLIIKLNNISPSVITQNISRFNSISKDSVNYNFDSKIIDLYTKGEYKSIVMDEINNKKYYGFSTFEILVKSIARFGDNPFEGIKKKIVEQLCSIILKQDNYYSCYYSILNICYAYRGLPWFQELQLFLSKESRFIGEKPNTHLAKVVSINAEEDTPRKLSYFDSENFSSYNKFINLNYRDSVTYSLFTILSKSRNENISSKLEPLRIDTTRYKKYLAISLLEKGEVTEAIYLLEDVISNSNLIDSFDGLKFLVNAYITNGLPEKAIKIFVEQCLDNKNNILIFDVEKIAQSARDLVNVTKEIEIPIALELYTRFVNDDYESALRVCLDSFIINNGLSNPIDLLESGIDFEENKVNYFLENVCTIRNMKLTLLLDSKVDIENCRIKICNYLIEKNLSKDKVVEELKSITKEHVFRKAIKQVDNSRIYVDISAFRDKRSKAYKAIFERFCELNKHDYSNYEDEKSLIDLSKVLGALDGNIFDSVSKVHLQDVTFNEKNRTFHKLISMLRDEFTFGEKGLNSYLSTRIRHGVLPTELRKSAQNEKLWLVEDSADIVRLESYWENKIPSLVPNSTHDFIISLRKFTSSYEAIIGEINDQWLQVVSLDQDISNIKSGMNKSKALFDYSISTTETYVLQTLIDDENYNKLIDIVLSWLWHRTDSNLSIIRYLITNKALDKFREVYGKLESELLEIDLDSSDVQTLLVIINQSKESVRNALSSISTWFNRSTTNYIESFEIDIAIDIAARATNANVAIVNDCEFRFKGRYLSTFVDIFYNLFDNSVNNCKLPLDELRLSVKIGHEQNDLSIVVSNNCSPVNMEDEDIKLNYYRNAYGDTELMKKASQEEGNTGIFKIYNAIENDFGVSHTNEFGFNDETKFETKIVINDLMEVARYESSDC